MPISSEPQPWSEYRLLVIQTMTDLAAEVKRLHDDNLVMKTRMAFLCAMLGAGSGIAGSVVTALIIHWMKIK